MEGERMLRKGLSNLLMRLLVITLVVALSGIVSYSESENSPLRVSRVELPGVNGSLNNFASAFGRYEFISPYAPSTPDDQEEIDISELDNNVVYLIDSKKPGKEPIVLSLGNCYFPTRILYDEESRYLYVRGSEYTVKDEIGSEREVVVKLRVSLDENGKPFMSEQPVTFGIPGEGGGDAVEAPSEFFLAHGGTILLVSNGYSVYSYNVVDGYQYAVLFSGDRITYMDYEDSSNTVILGFTKQEELEGGEVKYSTEISFYKLRDNGTMDLVRRVLRENFPEEMSLMEGSSVALSVNPESKSPEFGFFVGRNGAVCQIDLRNLEGGKKDEGTVDILGTVPELAVGESEVVSGREVSYNRAKRVLSVVKRGTKWNVRRPTLVRTGRPRVRRPTLGRKHEPPALVLVQLNRKNKIVGITSVVNEFAEKEGLSNLIFDGASGGVIVAQTGEMYFLDFADIGQLQPRIIGNVGTGVDHIGKGVGQVNFIGVSSFQPVVETGAAGGMGALVLVKVNIEDID